MKRFLQGLITCVLALTASIDGYSREVSNVGEFNPIISTGISSEGLHSIYNPSTRDTFAEIFANNVHHISQQQGSLLLPFAQMMGMVQTAQQITRLGTLPDPEPYVARGSQVTAANPRFDTRWVTAQRYWQACHVDSWDEFRTLYSIQNAYSQAMSMSFGRLYDRVLIAAALGSAYTGPGRAPVALPDAQKSLCVDSKGIFSPVSFGALNDIRRDMKSDFAIMKGDMLVYICTANEVHGFLQSTEITNRDYTNNLVLASGEVSAFMGFIFAETQLVPKNDVAFRYVTPVLGGTVDYSTTTTTGDAAKAATADAKGIVSVAADKAFRTLCIVANKSLCFGINMNMFSRVSERDDLHYIVQLYYAAEFGATRKEEIAVREIYSLDTRA